MKKVSIYTDGACRGNGSENALGAFGIVLLYEDNSSILHRKEIKKAFTNVTNNMMELGAVIEALELLKCPCEVELFSDSKYVCDAINKNWLSSWQLKGWITSTKKPVKNQELWKALIPLLSKHKIQINWVKGHASNVENNRCDKLANIAMNEFLNK